MPYARRDGVELHYERHGEGGEPELVFVPGWCCGASAFEPQSRHFGKRHAVTVVELRGFGRSSVPADGYDVATFADDVAALCAQAGVERPVVCGHSLGGMVAIELGYRYPGLVRGVVALDPGPVDPLPRTKRVFEAFAAQLAGPHGEEARRAWVLDGVVGPTADEAVREHVVEMMCAVPLATARAVIERITSWNGVGALALCEVPTLIVLSATVGSNAPDRLQAINPAVEIGVTVGAGHCHQLEVPEQVNAMIERFLTVALS
jgi:pimeloyl-ACP methyl ester carboxylesterase